MCFGYVSSTSELHDILVRYCTQELQGPVDGLEGLDVCDQLLDMELERGIRGQGRRGTGSGRPIVKDRVVDRLLVASERVCDEPTRGAAKVSNRLFHFLPIS